MGCANLGLRVPNGDAVDCSQSTVLCMALYEFKSQYVGVTLNKL